MKMIPGALFACVMMMLGASASPSQPKKFGAIPVTYEGLKQEILKHRGKVVVVDLWGTFCPPCVAAFPKFIKLHQDYEARGLVVISVSLDQPDDDGKFEGTDLFLTKQQSPLRNLVLNDPSVVWQDKFGCRSLPCYFIFDRRGRWVRFRGQDFPKGIDYAEIEKTIVRMLDEK